MTISGLQQLKVGRGGWCYYADVQLPVPLLVRFGLRGNRVVVVAVHVASEEGVTGTTLRSIPLGRIEATANAPSLADQIRRSIEEQAEAVDKESAAHWNAMVSADAPNVLSTNITFTLKGKTVTRSIPLMVPVGTGPAKKEPAETEGKKTSRRPDDFYRSVAERYAELARFVRNPAAVLAEESGVQSVTIHRWLKEARRRGLYNPSKKASGGSES